MGTETDWFVNNLISQLDAETYEWRLVGNLNTARYNHGAIAIAEQILVRGGEGEFETERCWWDHNENVTCTNQSPTLDKYTNYPELFIVPNDFCSF